jgi:hypothetical protein
VTVLVGRSALRLIGFVLLGSAMIVLAVDMTISYRFYPEPEANDVTVGSVVDGAVVDVTQRELTETGRHERRRDIAFGVALFAGGAAALGWGVREAVARRPVLHAAPEGLTVTLGPRGRPVTFGWEAIVEVRSGVLDDEGGTEPVLSLRFADAGEIPTGLRGAAVESPWLHIYAGDWDVPAHQVAPRVEAFATPYREDEYG